MQNAGYSGFDGAAGSGNNGRATGGPESAFYRAQRVFLRLPSTEDQAFWPWDRLRNKKLQRLISPCKWNDNKPPVRAYSLRKTGATRGVVLIEHLDLIKFLNQGFLQNASPMAPIAVPEVHLPPVLSIPAPGEECPVTGLKHTVMFELSIPFSPYGRTEIHISRYLLPGSLVKNIAIETQSLLRFIRSQPPPRYSMNSRPPGK